MQEVVKKRPIISARERGQCEGSVCVCWCDDGVCVCTWTVLWPNCFFAVKLYSHCSTLV